MQAAVQQMNTALAACMQGGATKPAAAAGKVRFVLTFGPVEGRKSPKDREIRAVQGIAPASGKLPGALASNADLARCLAGLRGTISDIKKGELEQEPRFSAHVDIEVPGAPAELAANDKRGGANPHKNAAASAGADVANSNVR